VSSVEEKRPNSSEIANPWKIGSSRMVAAPIIAESAVSRIGRKRIAPASSSTSRSVSPGRAWRHRDDPNHARMRRAAAHVLHFPNAYGLALRHGHHCAQPLMLTLGIEGAAHASLAPYTTEEDVNHLVAGLAEIVQSA
jgi:hypothetical protein